MLRADHPLSALPRMPIAALAPEPLRTVARDAGTDIWDQTVTLSVATWASA